jgi:hypothetical protein
MLERFFSWFARQPLLVNALIAFAQRTPYTHIYGKDGSLYMARWWLIKERAWLPFAARIHHIARPDGELHLHDHPFDFRTVILRNCYVEEDVFGRRTLLSVGHTHHARAQTFHRIAELPSGGAWTLFITSRRFNSWGFLVEGRKLHHREYFQRFLWKDPVRSAGEQA